MNRGSYVRMHGPAESCEDQICSTCKTTATAQTYGKCMYKCITDNQDAIKACCQSACNGQTECIAACNSYAPITPDPSMLKSQLSNGSSCTIL